MNTSTLPAAFPNEQDLPALYEANLTRVYQFIYVQVKNREVAEDLTSQVFLKAVRLLDHQRSPHSKQSWLLHVAHTTVMDYWRKLKRAPDQSLDVLLEAGWEMPDRDTARTASGRPEERVQYILQQLPVHYREVLIYRFLLKYSVRETAEIIGVTEANVKTLQFRALKRAASIAPDLTGERSQHETVLGK